MKDNPAAIRECLQGDCNIILRDTLHVFEGDTLQTPNVCDIDVDDILARPLKKITYGRTAKPYTNSVIPRTPEAQTAAGFIRTFLSK